MKRISSLILFIGALSLSFSIRATTDCFDRKVGSHLLQVDTHLHVRPFGTNAIPSETFLSILTNSGVTHATAYGIGQPFAVQTNCIHYINCPGVPTRPSPINDFKNVRDLTKYQSKFIDMTLSLSFPDLANPESILDKMNYIVNKHPNKFKWIGEVNLTKQALVSNGHESATISDINNWKPFMKFIADQNIPITIHSDLGHDGEPLKYVHLMRHVLNLYPENTIIWAHMGLSKELLTMPANEHVALMKEFLNQYPNLYLDMSWRILEDYYFSKNRSVYVYLLNRNPTRFINGTNFIASSNKGFEDYNKALDTVSTMHKYINNKAFRGIALGQNHFNLLENGKNVAEICINK